jgi:predicted SnoaL-like aldol condensation-catalyzing enzyme
MNVIKKIALALLLLIVLLAIFIGIRLNTIPTQTLDLSTIEILKEVDATVLAKNKTIVQQYYQALSSSKASTALTQSLAKGYIEHQVSAQYSQQGLADYLKKRNSDYPQRSTKIHRVIAQGNLVFLHVEETLNPQRSFARGELFRLAEGKITEHWSTEQEVPKEAANDNGMFGGAMPNANSSDGIKYAQKAVVDGFEAWENFNTERVLASTTERYIQHNPQGKDGAENFANVIKLFKVIRAVTGEGTKITTYRTLSEGDFIVLHTLSTDGSGASAVFDMLRVDEKGRKDEHWDIIQPIKNSDIKQAF